MTEASDRPIRIAVVTGTRAEFGLLHPVLSRLRDHPHFDLRIVATCMHLSPVHGLTVREIERDGFDVDAAVDMLLSADSDVAIAKSMGLGMIGMTDALARLAPDAVLVLGDRFEVLAAAATATALRVPIVHMEGGHVTEGAIDDAMRHAVTKLAHLHFTATEDYRRRIIQMGEEPERVHAVGSTGLDNVLSTPRLAREVLERELGFEFGSPCLVVTVHPETLQAGIAPAAQAEAVLAALDRFPEARILFTMPNADAGGHAVREAIEAHVAADPQRRRAVSSLGRVRYVSVLGLADAVVGNSSSGVIEVPSFGIGTVNVGDRQKGRLRAASVIDCSWEPAAIVAAIERALSADFQRMAARVENPYGDGHAAERIMAVLERTSFDAILRKPFRDLPPEPARQD